MAYKIENITGSDLGGSNNAAGRTYTLANAGYVDSTLSVALNGLVLHMGAGSDYTISASTITFVGAVNDSDIITLTYFTTAVPDVASSDIGYCNSAEVYAATKLTTSEVPEASVVMFIRAAEKAADNKTFTTYWEEEDSGTASAGATTTLTDSTKSWTVNDFDGLYVWVYGGTGSGQMREITSNTATELTVDEAWDTNPDNTSTYRIIYAATNPHIAQEYDGTGSSDFFLPRYPTRLIRSLTVDSTSVTTSNLYRYDDYGKIRLKTSAEVSTFTNTMPQLVDVDYWWGVYPIPEEVVRYTIVLASLSTLESQMGGTHNIPSTYSLPEGSVTIGQAYINIKGTHDVILKKKEQLEKVLKYYYAFA